MRIIRFTQPKRRAFRSGYALLAIIFTQLAFFAAPAHALGLGNLLVNSFLDEPLDLRVELILDPSVDNLEQVVFDLASRKEFSIAGISRPEFMDEIQFDIVPENGKNWLKISSASQMREPFLHILLRAEWDGGSLLREYTALIDPPVYSSQAPAPIMAPRIREEFAASSNSNSSAQTNAPQDSYAIDSSSYAEVPVETDAVPLVSETATTPVNQQSEPSALAYGSSTDNSYAQSSGTQPLPVEEAFGVYGPIEAGETLSGIASQLQQVYPELGYYQTLYVLHRDNQEAFIDGNMNLLKRGEILRIDSLDDIRNVSREVAVQVFQEQQGQWQGYLADRGKVAPTYVASDVPNNAAQGTIGGTSSQSSNNQGVTPVQDQFRIGSAEGASQSSSGTADDARALQNEISDLESSLLSSQLENSELRERLELLEIQLEEVNQLIALEDPTLAALQQGLSSAAPVEAGIQDQNSTQSPESSIGSAPNPETLPSGTTSDATSNVTPPSLVERGSQTPVIDPQAPDSVESSIDNGSGAEITSGQALVDSSAGSEGSSDTATPSPLLIVNEQSWFDRIKGYMPEIDFQNTTTLGIIGAAIAALGALLFLRRRSAQEEFEHSMLSMAVDGSHSQFDLHSVHEGVDLDEDEDGEEDDVPVDGRSRGKDSSFLTVYNDDAATVHSDDVDPLAEAEVYLAYGRDDQAIEVLKEGLKRSSDRFDIRVKLLEIYHKQENKAEFESLAEQFYADKKVSEDKLWRKVVKLAQGLGLSNPIFAATGDAMERLSSLLEVDSLEDLGLSEKLSEQAGEGGDTSMAAEPEVASRLDFDSKIEDSSSLEINADLDAIGSNVASKSTDVDTDKNSTSTLDFGDESEGKEASKYSDVVIEVESVIEEMSSVDILDPAGDKIESSSVLDTSSIEKDSENLAGYEDRVAADIETAASYLAPEEKSVETSSVQGVEDEVLLQTPSVESVSYFGVDTPPPLGAETSDPAPHNDSILEFDTHSVDSPSSVGDSIELPSMLDESTIDLSSPSINLDDSPSLLDVDSVASIQLDDNPSEDSLAVDDKGGVNEQQTLDVSTIDFPSENVANGSSKLSDSEFNVDLAESIEQYSEMLTPDATAVGELSELSDLMISESASDISSTQTPLDSEDIQTQLDLAKVYVELGDGEGAGQILKDVMEYGDSGQKKQAADILSELKA